MRVGIALGCAWRQLGSLGIASVQCMLCMWLHTLVPLLRAVPVQLSLHQQQQL
jgi:hypothetical protein